jgi:murein DD-endopeptidase MepM/ murein hydrolase activator NlpD
MIVMALLVQIQTASAGIDELQAAFDAASAVPSDLGDENMPQKTIDPAEAAVSSVKAIVGLMKQAIDVAAALPEKSPPQTTDLAIAIKVAAMLPKREAAASAAGAPVQKAYRDQPFKAPSTGASSLKNAADLLWPTDGIIYSAFFDKRGKSRIHGAIDIVTSKGVPILSVADGTVSVVASGKDSFRGYGKTVIVDHGGGIYTLYSHCDTILVKMGQRVKRGEYIATVGRTGRATTNHLHFEIRVAGKKVDPLKYLPERPEMVRAKKLK